MAQITGQKQVYIRVKTECGERYAMMLREVIRAGFASIYQEDTNIAYSLLAKIQEARAKDEYGIYIEPLEAEYLICTMTDYLEEHFATPFDKSRIASTPSFGELTRLYPALSES